MTPRACFSELYLADSSFFELTFICSYTQSFQAKIDGVDVKVLQRPPIYSTSNKNSIELGCSINKFFFK